MKRTFIFLGLVSSSSSSSSSSSNFVSSTSSNSSSGVLCAFTGKRVMNWETHSKSLDMRLFNLLKERLTSPTHPLPTNQIYKTIANPCRLIDEFMCSKTTRRLGRLRTALGFLRRHNVLLHSLLFYVKETQTWNTTPGFDRLALFGENILKQEVRARTLRLFPSIDSETFATLTNIMTSESKLCEIYDKLLIKTLVGAKPQGKSKEWSLNSQQKSHMLCAIIGEMYWFTSRTKATDRTHNNALFPPSDALILHVLSCHVLESLPAELIYTLIEPCMHRMKEVWVNQPMSLPEQLYLKPRTIGAHLLSLHANPISKEEKERKLIASTANVCKPLISSEPIVGSIVSTMKPRFNFKRFDEPRYQILKDDKYSILSLQSIPTPKNSNESTISDSLTEERRLELISLALNKKD